MRAWSQVPEQEYRRLQLRAHQFLADVPVHDVWCVHLPGRDGPSTLLDVRAAMKGAEKSAHMGAPVRALFRLRWLVGRLLGWDTPDSSRAAASFRQRLTARDREQSLIEPGTPDGPFTVLYVHPNEAVSEIRNVTVHGFVVWALAPSPTGYQLYLAVHVLPVSRWTRVYLAVIQPFRVWLVYPAMLRGVHKAWCEHVT